jgi:hypothetical protein
MVLVYAEIPCLTNPGRESGHFLEGVEEKADVTFTRVISAVLHRLRSRVEITFPMSGGLLGEARKPLTSVRGFTIYA